MVAALQAAGVRVSVVNPHRIRAFARARGVAAKTDRLDAAVLRDYGICLAPAPTTPLSAVQLELAALATEYQYVVASITREQGHAELLVHPPVSYTHLDVYKRQVSARRRPRMRARLRLKRAER